MDFETLFTPQSIALIGASREETSVGFSLLKNLLTGTYKGSVIPINPKATDILGARCYSSIGVVPNPVDTAIIAVPASVVYAVSEQSIAKGIKNLIIISAGFREQGEEGKKREEDLAKLCINHHVTLIGPNCLGILNPHIGLNASFETVLPKKGNIAFLSQSGALISSLIDIATSRGIGFSKIISLGNKTLIGEHELLPYLFTDPQTGVILLYAEFLTQAPELIGLIRENIRSDHPKPVILLKAGVSQAGQKASSSHTGSLAGSDAAYSALTDQSGIIRVSSVDELLSAAQVLSQNPLPLGNSLAIVTNAGGPGIIATDASAAAGLTLSSFSDETKNNLQSILPPASHVANPVDVLGDATSVRYEKVLTAIGNDPQVHSILTIVTPQSMTDIPETAASIVRLRNSIHKPIVATFMGAPHVEQATEIFSLTQVTHIQFPEQGVTALGHAAFFAAEVQKKREVAKNDINASQVVKDKIRELISKNTTLVDTPSVLLVLKEFGLPILKYEYCTNAEEAKVKAKNVGESLAIKIVSSDISHKSDVGGVRLNVSSDTVFDEYTKMLETVKSHAPEGHIEGVLVTEMVKEEGAEMILGIKREKGLGTLIMVGFGGIYVEVLKDTAFRFAPLTKDDAVDMVHSLKAAKLLSGVRGKPALDEEALIDAILKIAMVALSVPEISELDINPLLVKEKGKGAVILDARIVLSS
jgi:acetate---CoA ligase (ADP-forming)